MNLIYGMFNVNIQMYYQSIVLHIICVKMWKKFLAS